MLVEPDCMPDESMPFQSWKAKIVICAYGCRPFKNG